MAAVSTVHKNAVTLQLNNGTSDGKIKTVSQSLGSLAVSGFDPDKALNVADAMEEILSKEIVRVEHTQVSYLTRA